MECINVLNFTLRELNIYSCVRQQNVAMDRGFSTHKNSGTVLSTVLQSYDDCIISRLLIVASLSPWFASNTDLITSTSMSGNISLTTATSSSVTGRGGVGCCGGGLAALPAGGTAEQFTQAMVKHINDSHSNKVHSYAQIMGVRWHDHRTNKEIRRKRREHDGYHRQEEAAAVWTCLQQASSKPDD